MAWRRRGKEDQGPEVDAALAAMRRRPWFKRILPRGLFGRAILIIVVPVVLMEAIATWVFYDRHWDAITGRMVQGVVAEIHMVIDQIKRYPTPEGRIAAFSDANKDAALLITYEPGGELSRQEPRMVWDPFLMARLRRSLNESIGLPFRIDPRPDEDWIGIDIALPEDAVLHVLVPDSRVSTPTTRIFLYWYFGSAIALFTISLLFMRNQIRPIRRLAVAADAFGKGQEAPPDFKPEGALEVRQAAHAFLVMRERIQRQIEQRTELLAGVSHDLRTPLTRMRLGLALLPESEEVKDLLSDISEMEVMISGYLDFARGQGGEAEVTADLSRILSEIAQNARRGGLLVAEDIAPDLSLRLRPGEIRRCVDNLVANARRYGKGRIWLSAHKLGKRIEIAVEDDGPGIAADRLEDVFRPFVRMEDSRNPDTGGVGLGLTIARDIARGHGGDIRLAKSPHGGLRAVIGLPV
jgi:two-component system osmolarity sensor histidine kinase EnvZ